VKTAAPTGPAKKAFAPKPAPTPPAAKSAAKPVSKPAPKPPVKTAPVPRTKTVSVLDDSAPPRPVARVRPSVHYSLADIREYLKHRQGVKINAYVPGDERVKPKNVAARKAAALSQDLEPRKQNRQIGAVSVEDLLGFNPFKKDDAHHEEDQIPQKWRKYYRLLIDLRNKLQQGLSLHTEEALKKSGKEDSGDLSGYSQHMADAGTDSFDRDFALNLVSGEQEALFEISEAIERMKRGTYGICEFTNKPIPADRLTAVPFTRYSLEGQRGIERNRRLRRRNSTLGNPLTELGDGVTFGAAAGTPEDTEEQ
jgi:RNA polymerase-binding transcription factor DksA